MEDNIITWHGALKESLINKSSFYGMNFSRTIKIFGDMLPALGNTLRRNRKSEPGEEGKLEVVITSHSQRPILSMSKDDIKAMDGFINATEAGNILGVSHTNMKKRGTMGEVQMYIHPISKKNYFKKSDVEAYDKEMFGE
jgi:hypothetical protein